MNRILLILIVLGLSSCKNNNELIISADSADVISKYSDNLEPDALVIFDCDETLISFKDAVLRANNEKFLQKIVSSNKNRQLDFATKKGIVLLNAERALVNEKLPHIIKNIQKNEGKTLVITAMRNESCGDIRSTADWRIEELRKFGFNFDDSWKNLTEITFKSGVLFARGVIFAGKTLRSKALDMFLKHIRFSPPIIIFVDDKRENIEDMLKYCHKNKIKFIGIHYTEASKNEPEFSKKRAILQLTRLIEGNIWLSDKDAENKLYDSLRQCLSRSDKK